MDLELSGKRVWVLGASSGLGFGVGQAFLDEGADVVISSRPGDKLQDAERMLGRRGRVRAIPVDLQHDESLIGAASETLEHLGGIDIAFFNGGGPPSGPLADTTVEAFDAAYQLLLRPALEFLLLVSKPMIRQKSGVIAFSTTSGALEPQPNLALSNTMRAGVTGLAKTAAGEFGTEGIRVLTFAPGRIATGRTADLDATAASRTGLSIDQIRQRSEEAIAMRRYGTVEEYGRMVAFACSPVASYSTGTTISVDGGKARGLLS